ncbi:hypothetical protein NL868_001304 [Shigella flexneri]|nr:hypothetical protein [Shigella flexneri]
MKQDRLNILIELYDYAVEWASMSEPFKVYEERQTTDSFNFDYLDDAGYIRLEPVKVGEWDAYITSKGVDIVENSEEYKAIEKKRNESKRLDNIKKTDFDAIREIKGLHPGFNSLSEGMKLPELKMPSVNVSIPTFKAPEIKANTNLLESIHQSLLKMESKLK